MSNDAADPNAELSPTEQRAAAEWDRVRKKFRQSIMVDTSLSSLAQNLDMEDWPFKSAKDTPSKYVDLTYEELVSAPSMAGHPERVEQLIKILQETLAFDEPFGEMVAETLTSHDKDNPILKNIVKLGIPEDFPIALVALTPETREYCTMEGLTTIKQFAVFAQNLAQNVIVSGDFREFLNALSNVDDATLAQFLPFRRGSKNLHLLEGLALTVRAQPAEIQAALAQRYGARLGIEDGRRAKSAQSADVATAEEILVQQASAYIEYFQGDLKDLQQQIIEGFPLGRLATVLNDPMVESVVTGLLKPYLAPAGVAQPKRTTTPPTGEPEPGPKKGFFGSLARLFKK